ncbi:hypothetical [Prochlorococcus marinus str. MIT 9313]|uniref:Uncharacterized protein n=1 Tax=Prochlorococcus marinus (strain MIT 9313) TaxID=74547 RepID=Q7V6N5_PROMM|nr:hypothetical [Prochlorococcus marinus str. MIT 9313]
MGRHISSFAQHTHNLMTMEKLAKPENDLSSSVLPCQKPISRLNLPELDQQDCHTNSFSMKNTLLYIQKASEDQATTSCSYFNLRPLSDCFLQQQSQVEF